MQLQHCSLQEKGAASAENASYVITGGCIMGSLWDSERNGKLFMVKMSQVKVSAREVLKVSTEEDFKHGIISKPEERLVMSAAAKKIGITADSMHGFKIQKKSLDARKKDNINYIYQVVFGCREEKKLIKRYGKNDVSLADDIPGSKGVFVNNYKGNNKKIVIAGMGPAGLFAALTLAQAGLAPVVLERGEDAGKRREIVESFWNGGNLNPECNVQFGEGGAGTFSDGKLNTLVKDKDGYNRRVLNTFVEAGAPPEILYLQKPHIGTDRLGDVVESLRKEILRLGGEVYFNTKLNGIACSNGILNAVETVQAGVPAKLLECTHLILATGHSARDTFYMLNENGIYMEPKPFAIGVRVEHPQKMIGYSQYGSMYTKLPAADYKLAYTTKEGRGVYSFCMCPGGYVVNASSEQGRLAINGMSNYNRDGRNANSAIVVTVSPGDFGGEGALAGIEFQRRWEEKAYKQACGKIPVQLLADFCNNVKSTGFGSIIPDIKGDYELADVRAVLPGFAGNQIAEGIMAFEKKIKGYSCEDAVLSGIESRTSSPVRITRGKDMQANIHGIYPCGEGAGYAGGIMSAAVDGIRVAESVIRSGDI